MEHSVENRVINVIAKTHHLAPEAIQLDQPIETICEDSLALVHLLFELEDEFDLTFPEIDSESKTIRDIIGGIETLLQAKQEPVVDVA